MYCPSVKALSHYFSKQKQHIARCAGPEDLVRRRAYLIVLIFFSNVARCAGPEDLVTAERIWAETKDGDYSGAYKEQMSIFMGEIREFFNAGGIYIYIGTIRQKRPIIEAKETYHRGKRDLP